MKLALRSIVLLCLLLVSCGREEAKEYKIGRDIDWYPLDLLGRQNAVTAFSDELVRRIGREEDFRATFATLSGHMLDASLRQGKIDAVLASIPSTPTLRKYYDFSDVYLYAGPVLVVKAESSATALADLADKNVGIVSGMGSEQVVSKIPDVVIRQYYSILLALDALADGEIDGAVVAAIPTYAYVDDVYHQLKVVTPPLTNDGIRLVVLKGENADLVEAFNSGLKKMIKDGTYNEIAKKWQLDLGEFPEKNDIYAQEIVDYWSQQ